MILIHLLVVCIRLIFTGLSVLMVAPTQVVFRVEWPWWIFGITLTIFCFAFECLTNPDGAINSFRWTFG
ncbi:MAG: hypothetical protein N5P05_000743 [Chroococcopsis gigantea SAG 12.99]|jgi:hypothetical protein|nr:hypothetical protein [Chroococcopsis gigantea SAG 12.99]